MTDFLELAEEICPFCFWFICITHNMCSAHVHNLYSSVFPSGSACHLQWALQYNQDTSLPTVTLGGSSAR